MKYICVSPILSGDKYTRSISTSIYNISKVIDVGTIYSIKKDSRNYGGDNYIISSIDTFFGDQLYYGIELCSLSCDNIQRCFKPLREYNLEKVL